MAATPGPGAPAPDPVPSDREIQPALDLLLAGAVGPLLLALGALFAVFTVMDRLSAVTAADRAVAGCDGAMAVALLAAGAVCRRWAVPARWAHRSVGLLAAVVLAYGLVVFGLRPQPVETMTLVMLALGCGVVFLSRAWLAASLAGIGAAWAGVVARAPADPDWLQFGQILATAGLLAVVVHEMRLRAFRRAERLRVVGLRRQGRLEDALEGLRRSEQRFRTTFESAPVGMVTVGPGLVFHEVNEAFCRLTGYSAAELRGMTVFDLNHPDDNPRDRAMAEAMFEGGLAGYAIEKRYLTKDGREIWVDVTVARIAQPGPGAAPALAIVEDVTARKAAEDGLRESEERFRRLSEAAFEGIVIHDEGRILEANRAFAAMYGYDPQEVVGRAVLDFVAPDWHRRVEDNMRGGGERPYEIEGIRRDGSRIAVEVVAKTIHHQGRQARVVAVRDVTDLRRAREQRLQDLQRLQEIERLRQIDRFKTDFINSAAHELRTPLTPIKIQLHFLKTARSHELGPDARRAVEVVERNVDRLTELVDHVLEVARLQGGRIGVERHSVDLNKVVLEAVESFHEQALGMGVRLETRLEPDVWAVADPRRVIQTLFTLLHNALKFTPRGGTVALETGRGRGAVQVRVRDTGVGIDPEAIEGLFQPFAQGHDTMQMTRAGTGLGLYIARSLVEMQGGQIWATSEGPGRGACFTFTLPRAAPEDRGARMTGGSPTVEPLWDEGARDAQTA